MIAVIVTALIVVVYSVYIYYRPQPEISEMLVIKDKQKIVDMYKGFRRMRHIYGEFELWELYNILTEDECKNIINISEEHGLVNSSVGRSDGKVNIDTTTRKSQTVWITKDRDPLIERISKITESLTDLPAEHQENLQVAKYEKGGMLIPHYDASITNSDISKKKNREAGQRKATFLIYLNEDFKGGETVFPLIGLSIRPKRGKAILFWNIDKDEHILKESKHQGMPVLEGQKYICTKWSHVRAYSLT